MKKPNNNQSSDLTQAQEGREMAVDKLRFSSRQLFGTQNVIFIEHQGTDYRLSITSNGKLILTK